MPGALKGVRVLEFSETIAAPLTGMLLGDVGADVISMERPGGDLVRRGGVFAPGAPPGGSDVTDADAVVEDPVPRLPWQVLEIAALAVVVSTAVLIVAGVTSGILIGTVSTLGAPNQAGFAAEFATAQWSGSFPALLLLGAIVACWWQQQLWTGPADDERPAEAPWPLERAYRLARWANAGLALAVLGAIAALVGRVVEAGGGSGAEAVASSYVPSAAELLATILVAAAGTLMVLRLSRGAPYEADDGTDIE